MFQNLNFFERPVQLGLVTFFLSQLAASPFSFAENSEVKPASEEVLMASLGDSMTSATFANTTAIESEDHKKPVWESLTVLKDIILGVGANKDTFSWSSGQEIQSHFVQLKKWMEVHEPGVKLTVKNFSVPGVKSEGLKDQADQIVEELRNGNFRYLKYVTVTIGGNDICTSKESEKPTEPEEFKKNVQALFDTLATIQQEQPIQIFISSIPNAPNLGKKEFLDTDVGRGYTCGYIRSEIHNSCENLLNFKTDEEYQANLKIVIQQNDLLRTLTQDAQSAHPQLHTYFSDTFFNTQVTPDMLGYDCFHPNKKGQDMLGRSTFEEQPFFK